MASQWKFSRLAILIFLLSLSSCSPGEDSPMEPMGYATRDSAGVTIVESSLPAWREGEGWTLTQEPLLSIGEMEGPDEYTLYRSGSAVRLDDGRIAVANGGSQEIRFYDEEGRFLHGSGGDGEGPGEFRSVGFIWRLGTDSLAVLDYRLFRISIFDLDGVFGRTVRLEGGENEMVFPSGLFGDGSLLGLATLRDGGENLELGSFRDLVEHRHYDRDGHLLSTLVVLPGSELVRAARPDGSAITTGPRHGLTAWTVTGKGSFIYGPADSYEIQEWSQDGELLKVARLEKERRETPAQEITNYEESVAAMNPQRRQLWEAVPIAGRLPAYEQVLLDRTGNLWLLEYLLAEEAPVWQVLDTQGVWLGEVAMPPGGRISEIGEDYVLGVWKDEMDVERIRLYGLVKPGNR
jgi:hypothetical protein